MAHALASGLDVQRVALLAPPTNYGYFARRAIARGGLPPALADAWLDALKQVIGHDADEIDLGSQVRGLRIPGMLVYSDDDQTVSPEALDSVAAVWPDVTTRRCTGLGHQGILLDADVLEEIVRFAALTP